MSHKVADPASSIVASSNLRIKHRLPVDLKFEMKMEIELKIQPLSYPQLQNESDSQFFEPNV